MKAAHKTLAAALALAFASAAHAIPTLQLDIEGGTYDATTQTVIASANVFTLYAYLIPDANNTTTDTYALSMAVAPKTGPAASNLGSFKVDTSTVNVTADMVYGTPPIETIATQLSDPGDLGDHGIFDTFFAERTFSFGSAQSGEYDAQTSTGIGPQPLGAKNMYYVAFAIDVSNLASSVSIHFDLYNTLICDSSRGQCADVGDVDQSQFAPFSHDAQSGSGGGGGGGGGSAPEPGSLALLGIGLAGLGLRLRRARMA